MLSTELNTLQEVLRKASYIAVMLTRDFISYDFKDRLEAMSGRSEDRKFDGFRSSGKEP